MNARRMTTSTFTAPTEQPTTLIFTSTVSVSAFKPSQEPTTIVVTLNEPAVSSGHASNDNQTLAADHTAIPSRPDSSNWPRAGLIAGASIGAVLGLALIVSVVYFLIRKFYIQPREIAELDWNTSTPAELSSTDDAKPIQQPKIAELPSPWMEPAELPGSSPLPLGQKASGQC